MLKVYGIKIDKKTGEVLKEKTLLYRSITEHDLNARGIKTALENGYTITEIIEIGTIQSHFADKLVYTAF